MLAQKVRISPSGPNVTNDTGGHFIPGVGMVMRAEIQSASTDGQQLENTGGPYEIKDNILNSDPPFMRPEFENCQLGSRYSAKVQATLYTREWWATSQIVLSVEGSIDEGANWMVFSRTATTVPGAVVAQDDLSSLTLGYEMIGLLGSDITGLVEGGSLMIRALLLNGGDNTSVLTTAAPNGSPADAASGNYLVLKEKL